MGRRDSTGYSQCMSPFNPPHICIQPVTLSLYPEDMGKLNADVRG